MKGNIMGYQWLFISGGGVYHETGPRNMNQ